MIEIGAKNFRFVLFSAIFSDRHLIFSHKTRFICLKLSVKKGTIIPVLKKIEKNEGGQKTHKHI